MYDATVCVGTRNQDAESWILSTSTLCVLSDERTCLVEIAYKSGKVVIREGYSRVQVIGLQTDGGV